MWAENMGLAEMSEEMLAQTEFRFRPITGKYVIYRGKSQDVNGIHYWNVEEYLNNRTPSPIYKTGGDAHGIQ